MHKKFVSIAQPEKIGFALDTDAYSSRAQTSDYFRVFETFGDGLTQHSGDVCVSPELLADYLASLTQAMLKDDELADRAAWRLQYAPSEADLQFAASVIFKETDREFSKRRYVSLQEKKITSNPDKRHDKRYQEIVEWMDGTAPAILGLVTPEYPSGMERYCYIEAVRNWALKQPERKKGQRHLWLDLPGLHCKWFASHQHEEARQLHCAFEMAVNTVRAYQLRKHAEGQLDCYRQNFCRKTAPAAEETAA